MIHPEKVVSEIALGLLAAKGVTKLLHLAGLKPVILELSLRHLSNSA